MNETAVINYNFSSITSGFDSSIYPDGRIEINYAGDVLLGSINSEKVNEIKELFKNLGFNNFNEEYIDNFSRGTSQTLRIGEKEVNFFDSHPSAVGQK